MNKVDAFYKKWFVFLKTKRIYGRYLLDIQIANRKRNEYVSLWDRTFLDKPPIEEGDWIYFSKKDYFDNRFKINNMRDLVSHVCLLTPYIGMEEVNFLLKACKEYAKLIREEMEQANKNKLPVPRSFRRAKREKSKLRGGDEENAPWYNSFYQNRKIAWKR